MRTEERLQDIEEKAKSLEKTIEEHSFVWEIIQKTEREKKRWFIAWIITFILLLAVTAGSLYINSTDYDVYTLTQSTDEGGDINYAGGNINYGVPEN